MRTCHFISSQSNRHFISSYYCTCGLQFQKQPASVIKAVYDACRGDLIYAQSHFCQQADMPSTRNVHATVVAAMVVAAGLATNRKGL